MKVEHTDLFGTDIRTVYRGSDKIIQQPQYGFGNKANDYGQGYYVLRISNALESGLQGMTRKTPVM